MNRRTIVTLTALALAVIPGIPSVYGQDKPRLTVQIPFEFVARGKNFPAGTYSFSSKQGLISLTNSAGKDLLVMQVITSLARSSAEDDHLLAFDKVEGKKILSEVWLPNASGALVTATRGEHDHEIIHITKSPKR